MWMFIQCSHGHHWRYDGTVMIFDKCLFSLGSMRYLRCCCARQDVSYFPVSIYYVVRAHVHKVSCSLVCGNILKVFQTGNCKPFTDYRVKDVWITTLVQAGKISLDAAEDLYVACGFNVVRHLANIDEIRRRTEDSAVDRAITAAHAAVLPGLFPIKMYAEIVEWSAKFREPALRRQFVVLEGPSWVGKSHWVRMFCWHEQGQLYEVDLSGKSLYPNLKRFRFGFHTHILLDEGSVQCVLHNRKLLQGVPARIQMGQSPTNQFAYEVCTYGVKFFLTSNVWTAEMEACSAEDRAWLSRNIVHVVEPSRCFTPPD